MGVFMGFKVGDLVDWVRSGTGKQREHWHGIVFDVSVSGVSVMWLKSDVSTDISRGSAKTYFHRGYATLEKPSNLVACDAGSKNNANSKHPTSNPWVKKYGLPD